MSNRRQARARAQSRSAHHHKEQSVNTQASQGPTEETPATSVQPTAAATQPAEFPRNPDEQAAGGIDAVGKIEHKGGRNPDVERSPQAGSLRRRAYEHDVDVTAQGTGPIISLPTYGHLQQLPKSVDDLEHAWFSLFNERENGAKLIADLRSLVIPAPELDILMYEVRRREETDPQPSPLYLIAACDKKDKGTNAIPVARYLVSTNSLASSLVKMASPVKATSIFKFGPGEDVSIKYKFHNEADSEQGPTEETPAAGKDAVVLEGGILDRWLKADHFIRSLPAYFWFADDQLAQIRGAIWNTRLPSAKVLMTEAVDEPGSFAIRVASSDRLNEPVLDILLYTEIDDGGEKRRITDIVIPTRKASVKQIEPPKFWLPLGELARRWKAIFNEDEFGQIVVSRLGDLEKRQGSLTMRILRGHPQVYLLQVFRTADLPSMVFSGDQAITKTGHLVEPIETIRLWTTIVEGVEAVARLEVPDAFASPRHAPKQSAEQIAAESRKAAVINLQPSDMRTFDAIAFQQFVDQVRQANLALGDAARLVAFMEFIAKCQKIEQTLFFHCTAYGRQLDMMLGAGKRHFPGASAPTPGSMFASGARWSSMGQPSQNTANQTYIQPNQTACDVVISVYGSTGALLGVFQCAVPPAV